MSEARRASVMIVDDDRNTRDGLQRALRRNYDVHAVESAERALALIGELEIDVMLTDVRMPGMDGLTLLRRVQARSPQVICILLTAYGSVETAVEAMKGGAYDFLTKPINLDHLELLLQRALRARDVEAENTSLHQELDQKFGLESLIGDSPAMQEVFEVVRQAAPTQATVLVTGPSGTGKELIAHAVHRLSTRNRGPFIAVHCAALQTNLLESELFGHEKGSYTGAASQRKGRFEMADGGTLFLDEIGEIDASVQVKLLRVLEERRFERVGGSQVVEVDIRLICATNRNLREMVAKGEFREDLFYRLDVVNVALPSLCERGSDIPLLAMHFLSEFSEKNGRDIEGMTSDAINVLSAYSWPGNVRELRNTIEKMVVLSRGDRLTARDVPLNIRESAQRDGIASSSGALKVSAGGSLADTERAKILAVLRRNDNNRTQAAEELGISRRTLHRKLKRYLDEGQE